MNAKDLFKVGRLSDAREELIKEVKSFPADLDKRTFLFQVLAFCGEWDKAERHLELIAAQDPERETGVQVYKNLIHGEKERMEVLNSNSRPSFLPAPPPYTDIYYEAMGKLSENKVDEARKLFDQSEEQRPVIAGTINGKSFSGFMDTDTSVSFFIEAIAHERYVCIPVESISEITISSPKTLFDLVWISANLITREGLTMNCYLPVLYAGSFLHDDDLVKLGKMTDWVSLGGLYSKGSGQHVFQIGEEEISILEIGKVIFNHPDIDK
ncbi:MAG: type VI secretion system accessory protein TagJ [Planctomycetota bacterium]|jgi:type VI secretion system protein ImpE